MMEQSDSNVSADDKKAVIKDLQQHDICPRCILRVVGVRDPHSYGHPEKKLAELISLAVKTNQETLAIEDQAVDPNKPIIKEQDNNPEDNGMEASADDGCNKETSIARAIGPDEVSPESADTSNNSNKNVGRTETVCGLCLGILQGLCEKECAQKLADQVMETGCEFATFMMAVKLPLQLDIRQNCLLVHMSEKLKPFESIASIKEVYKWVAGPKLGDQLDVPFHPKSLFEVVVTVKHDETEVEIETLLEKYGIIMTASGEPPKKRHRGHRRNRNRANLGADPTRPQIERAIKGLSTKLFKEMFPCPPKSPSQSSRFEVKCTHCSIYLAGRYMKYSRKLSQSPWVVDGNRKTESSVEELICEYMKAQLHAEGYKFSSSGREDVDVRTLGRGRPFVIEFINPRVISLSTEQLKEIKQAVNDATKDIKIRDLQMITREQTSSLKEGEEEKTKSYSALIWVQKEITEDTLKFLKETKELVLKQKTPIRVLHRRPLATRERTVHNMSYECIDSHHFKLLLNTQAGTYVKEFVHGDFGRTVPNLGILLDTEVDILELDVEAVNLDWPPTIDD